MSASSPTPASSPARVVDVVVNYCQQGEGVPEGGRSGSVSQRRGSLDRRMLLPCANPACKKGGFFLRPAIDKAIAAAKTKVSLEEPCAGYTGTLRSERGPAERCPNALTAEVEIAYAAAPKPSAPAAEG